MKRLPQYDVYALPAGDIYFDAGFNCRGSFTLQSVADLADSIRQSGLQFPVVVQPYTKKGYQWRLLAGHRRFKAVTTFLKWETIPATVRHALTEHQARILNLTENLERKDLNMLEEARALRNLYPGSISLRQASRELKRPTRWIHIRFRLLELPGKIQKMAAAGILSAVNLEGISKLEAKQEQIKAAEAILKAKRRGKTKFLDIDPRYKRRFQPRKSKQQISEMVIKLINLGIDGLGTRLLAWTTGYVSDAEIQKDIEQYVSAHKLAPRAIPIPLTRIRARPRQTKRSKRQRKKTR